MEKDERLLPLPEKKDLQVAKDEYPAAYSPFYDEESFEERRSLREYFNVVYKRLPLILALTILVTSAVAFYMYRQPSLYSATSGMIIEPPKPQLTSKDATIINFGSDINYTNTQLQLLQNPELMRDVVIRLGLHRTPNLFANQNKGLLATVRSMFSGDKGKSESGTSLPLLTETENRDSSQKIALTPEEQARADEYGGILLGGLRVDQIQNTNIVNITIQSTNPEIASKAADMTAELFIEKNVELSTQGTKKAYEDLTKSIDELKTTISNKEAELISLLSNSNLPLQEKGGDFRNNVLQTLYGQYQEARNERLKIEARYNTALQASNRGEGANIPDLTDQRIYQEQVRLNAERRAKLQDRISEIDKQIEEAEKNRSADAVKYTDEHPKIKEWNAKIDSLKQTRLKTEKEVTATIERDQQKLEKDAVSGALVSLRSQLNSANKREQQLYEAYKNEEQKANFEGQAETKLTTLKREIETQRGLLDTYTQRQKEQELALSSGRPDNLKVSSQAVRPTAPIGPQRNRNIMVAFLISLAAGIGLAFLLDYLDDSVKTSDDIGRHLGLPTLALIPHQNLTEKRKLGLVPKNSNGAPSTALITLENTRSAMAESFRHLRTSLLFSSAGKPPQTILVTSSQPAEGKTTTAINTAITLAQSGAEVVVIDCDLRRPRLHSHFDLPNSSGLTNYLSGEKNPDILMKPYPNLPKLKIITSGPIPPNPAELLSSNEMRNLLQFLKGNFKHVIIDSPPAISFTDAAILSTLVDGVVLVAMAGKSSIHLMRRFKQRLANIGARIYGVVLNGIKADSVEYGYYGYGYTYNYYSANDDDSTPLMEEVETVSSVHETKS